MSAEPNQHPIQVLVNYWEVRPAMIGVRLDQLIRHGVHHICTIIPWQAVESDISHSLARFLQAVADRKMSVDLILTPEVGAHYPNSGLPKDVTARAATSDESLARHVKGGTISVQLAPNGFQLPSLYAPELTKRYYSYLARMDGILADLEKNQPNLLKGVGVVLTGSYWKYYRSPQNSSKQPYSGMAGDYSGSAGLAYRQRVEQYFSQREFADPNPMASNKWKTRALEEVNRRWFHQHSEDVFRNRTFQLVRKKALSVRAREIELHTPEADPGVVYNNFLMMLSGGHGDFARLSTLIDESAARASQGSSSAAAGYIHWTSLGGFRSLADPEKQFLILKSLLMMGGQGGGIVVDESEWFALSVSFRARVEAFAKALSHKDMKLRNQALYLTPHLWSQTGTLWDELFHRVGPGARMVSSLEWLQREKEAPLLIVDPSWIVTRDTLQRVLAWVQSGRVAVMPKTPLFTEAARMDLDQALARSKRIEIDLGIPYRLYGMGEGKFVLYDMPESRGARGEMLSAWQTFLTAILSVAEVEGHCRMSDSRLTVIPLEKYDQGLGLFVLNGTRRPVSADIIFQGEVSVSDLAVSLAGATGATAKGSPPVMSKNRPAPASRFALDVPPCGILPLAVDGLELHGGRLTAAERLVAAETSGVTRASADKAALSELPGFDPSAEGLWS